MSPERLHRWSGAAFLAGCSLLVIGDLLRIVAPGDVTSTLLASGWLVQTGGAVLVVLGLPALYARLSGMLGIAGLLGYVALTLFLLIFGIFAGLLHGLALPGLASQGVDLPEPTSVLVVMVSGAVMGMLSAFLLGLATWRSGVLPRWAAVLMIVGGVAMLVGRPMPLHIEDDGLVLYLIGLAWLGARAVFGAPIHRATSPVPATPLAR